MTMLLMTISFCCFAQKQQGVQMKTYTHKELIFSCQYPASGWQLCTTKYYPQLVDNRTRKNLLNIIHGNDPYGVNSFFSYAEYTSENPIKQRIKEGKEITHNPTDMEMMIGGRKFTGVRDVFDVQKTCTLFYYDTTKKVFWYVAFSWDNQADYLVLQKILKSISFH